MGKNIEENTKIAITGGVLGGFTIPSFGAIIIGALLAVVCMFALKAIMNEA